MPKPSPWKVTPLMLAAKDGHLSDVITQLETQPKLDECDNSGNSALNLAAENGHTDVVEALLKAGAQVDIVNERGETALLLSERWQRYPCILILLANNASLWHEDNQGYSFCRRPSGFEWWGDTKDAQEYIQKKIDGTL